MLAYAKSRSKADCVISCELGPVGSRDGLGLCNLQCASRTPKPLWWKRSTSIFKQMFIFNKKISGTTILFSFLHSVSHFDSNLYTWDRIKTREGNICNYVRLG